MDQFKKVFLNVRESVVRLRRAQTITRARWRGVPTTTWAMASVQWRAVSIPISGLSDRRSCRFFTFESNGRGGSGESGNWRGRRDRELPTSRFVYAQHFQPEGMLIGLVPFQVGAFHLSLLPIPLGEIDQARALRAEHVHTQA